MQNAYAIKINNKKREKEKKMFNLIVKGVENFEPRISRVVTLYRVFIQRDNTRVFEPRNPISPLKTAAIVSKKAGPLRER